MNYRCGSCYLCLNEKESLCELDKEETHRSIDTCSLNIHIVPVNSTVMDSEKIKKAQIICKRITEIREKICVSLLNKNYTLMKSGGGGWIVKSGKKRYPTLYTEKFVGVQRENGYDYLLCFETLYCDSNTINCKLGKLQYFKCRRNCGINQIGGNRLMYPNSDQAATYPPDEETKHCVCNSKYTIYDSIDSIVEDFIEFMDKKRETP